MTTTQPQTPMTLIRHGVFAYDPETGVVTLMSSEGVFLKKIEVGKGLYRHALPLLLDVLHPNDGSKILTKEEGDIRCPRKFTITLVLDVSATITTEGGFTFDIPPFEQCNATRAFFNEVFSRLGSFALKSIDPAFALEHPKALLG